MTQREAHCVLDASAVLAWLQKEDGHDIVDTHLDGGVISSVNWSEVLQKVMARRPAVARGLRADLEALGLRIAPFGVADAEVAAQLAPAARDAGLSFTDRACLALAYRARLPALTADRAWKSLAGDVKILTIR